LNVSSHGDAGSFVSGYILEISLGRGHAPETIDVLVFVVLDIGTGL